MDRQKELDRWKSYAASKGIPPEKAWTMADRILERMGFRFPPLFLVNPLITYMACAILTGFSWGTLMVLLEQNLHFNLDMAVASIEFGALGSLSILIYLWYYRRKWKLGS